MATKIVQVRHKVTGAKTFMAESALPHFPDYVKTPSQKSREEVPDGSAFPAGTAGSEPDDSTPTTSSASTTTTPKEK